MALKQPLNLSEAISPRYDHLRAFCQKQLKRAILQFGVVFLFCMFSFRFNYSMILWMFLSENNEIMFCEVETSTG